MKSKLNYNNIFNHLSNLNLVVMAGLRVRSGTDFFHSLLDGHPEIVQTTGSCLYNYYSFWNATIYKDDLDSLIEEFIYDPDHIGLFDSRFNMKEKWGKLGIDKNEYFEVDKQLFKSYVNNLMCDSKITSRNFFLAINGAYSMCIGIDILKTKFLFFHAHTVENIDLIMNDFPLSEVLLMIRELREGALSFIENKSLSDPSYYMPSSCVNPFKEYSMINNFNSKYDIKYISLKDLHHNPDIVLKNFCHNLNIEYKKDVLLRSDYHGKLWWGDVLSKKDLQGFNASFGEVNKWKSQFSYVDNMIIEFLFKEEYQILNYETAISKLEYKIMYILFPLLVIFPMRYELKILKYNIIKKKGLRRIITSPIFYLIRIKMYLKVYFLKLSSNKATINKF